MRPFKIPKTIIWVDLDTIQSIDEPVFLDRMGSGGYYIVLRWQHAFRDNCSERWFGQEANYKERKPIEDSEGNPSRLKETHRDVFEPFFNEWVKR